MRIATIIMATVALDHWGVPEPDSFIIMATLSVGVATAIAADVRDAFGR